MNNCRADPRVRPYGVRPGQARMGQAGNLPVRRIEMIYKKAENIVARKIVDELLLVPVQGKLANMERVFTLNEVGEFIWDNLDGNTDTDGLVEKIVNEYDVDIDKARQDCEELLKEMLDAGVIA